MDIKKIVDQVNEIAIAAGKAIMEVYNSDNFDVEVKGDDSPLTRADKKANDIICAGLISHFPDIPIISEENKTQPYDQRKEFSYCWMVDPLDGTKEFIKRNGEFTVNIALIRHGNPIMGVVYVPVTEQLFWAMSGHGAWKVDQDGSNRISCRSFSMEDEGLKVVCSRSHLNEGTQAYIDRLNNPIKISKGSSLKFLVLATGEADLYPRLAPTMEWDTAAAHAILKEAGGTVVKSDLPEDALEYNKEDLLNPHFFATGNVHEA